MKRSNRVATGEVVFLEPYLTMPSPDSHRFSVIAAIPKKDIATMKSINMGLRKAYYADEGIIKGEYMPYAPAFERVKKPFRKNEQNDDYMQLEASSYQQPIILDSEYNITTEPDVIYSECKGRAIVNFYGYNSNGCCGIGCNLCALMKTADAPEHL